MDIKLEDKENSKKEIEISLSVEEMDKYVSKAVDQLSSEMKIKGFRPGKAPREVVENSVGKEKVWREAARIAVESTYSKAIEEKDLFPISQPQVEFSQLAPGNKFVYKAQFYIMPEFELPNYKKIAAEVVKDKKKDVEVDDNEIDETLERIRESRASIKKVERKAKKDDEVTISFVGKVDGEKKIEEDGFEFSLGSGQFDSLEGFEDQVIGMEAGEDKDFKVTIPKESPNKELAGKSIDFNLKLEAVSEKELPELNDELASSLHKNVSDLKELKEKIKEGIESEKKTKEDEALKLKIVEGFLQETDISTPEVLVERELDNMKNQMERQIQQSGTTFEDYLDQIGKTEEDLKNEWREKAKKNVDSAIILHKISEEEKIEVPEEEIESEVEKHLKMSGKSKEDEEDGNLERLRTYIHDIKKNQKIFDFLMK